MPVRLKAGVRLQMDVAIRISLVLSFLCGLIFLFQSMCVLHSYEIEMKKRPPAYQFWPFNSEMKSLYPRQAKVGRVLETAIIILALPWLVMWVIY